MKREAHIMSWDEEEKFFEKGYSLICGTDEAGRGPLAGPVYAAAVILPAHFTIPGLNDSKKLSEKKREELFGIITENALSYAICSCTAQEIDALNILEASQSAMRKAVASLKIQPQIVLVDGNVARGFEIEAHPIVGGDAKSPNIAAASILAKVSRDRVMLKLDSEYPQYGFAKHKGYPTKDHMDAVRQYGPCPYHRLSFLKFLNK